MAKAGFFKHNGLSITLTVLFLLFWGGQAASGFATFNDDQRQAHKPPVSFVAYLRTPHFWEATTENWESEFLQMGLYTVLTTFLFQKGSAESRDPDKKPEKAPSGPPGRTPPPPKQETADAPAIARRRGIGGAVYKHSLSIALFTLFFACWAGHAVSGWRQYNVEQLQQHGEIVSFTGFLVHPEFWFQSMQNWQSEFLAILAMVVLTIFLREEGSSQSKDVESPDAKTGSDD